MDRSHQWWPRVLAWTLASGAVLVALCLPLSFVTKAQAAPAAPVTSPDLRLPKQLKDVGIDERLGQSLPLDLPFVDDTGRPVHLRDAFDGKHPVIVTMNYSNCPMLCSLELRGLAHGLAELEWSAGQEFRVVTVSFDPKETPEQLAEFKRRYVDIYGRDGASAGWQFLAGREHDVRALADGLGFRYHYDAKKDQYYHAAALAIATPDGRVGRYLYGIKFDPQTLRLGLVEASEGKIGTTIDKLILFCCAYDPKEGSYAVVATRVMTVAGAVTVVVLALFLGLLWRAEVRKARRQKSSDAQ